MNAAGLVTSPDPAVRAGAVDADGPTQRCCQTKRCSSCDRHADPLTMWYGRCQECRANDRPDSSFLDFQREPAGTQLGEGWEA